MFEEDLEALTEISEEWLPGLVDYRKSWTPRIGAAAPPVAPSPPNPVKYPEEMVRDWLERRFPRLVAGWDAFDSWTRSLGFLGWFAAPIIIGGIVATEILKHRGFDSDYRTSFIGLIGLTTVIIALGLQFLTFGDDD
jgi:hypothetical protein